MTWGVKQTWKVQLQKSQRRGRDVTSSIKGAGISWALYVENRNQNTYRRYSGALKPEGKKMQNSDHELNSWPQTWERHINYIVVVVIPSSMRNPQKLEAKAMFKAGNTVIIHENHHCASCTQYKITHCVHVWFRIYSLLPDSRLIEEQCQVAAFGKSKLMGTLNMIR